MIAKIFKFLGIIFAVFLISLLVFVNTALFDKFLASRIKDKVLFNTGLELNFGNFYVSVFKGKLQAKDIKLGNVLKIKKVDFEISTLKLLVAKLDIEKARVFGIDVNVDRDFKMKPFSKNPEELDEKGFGNLVIRDFRLEDVNVHFSDKTGNVASFVSKDFLIQAGFNDKKGTYSGVVAFNNGQVVYNNNPYLLNVACYFDFDESALTIKELSISTGGLNIKSKGKFAKKGNTLSIKGDVDLYQLTKVEELKGVKAWFNLKGNLKLLKGKISITDGKRKAKGALIIDILNKKVQIKGLKGDFKEHRITLDTMLHFKKKLKITLASSIKGKYLKNFHANIEIVKNKEWDYNARFYGVDCGNGVCGIKVISGKIPKLSTVKLNLPILKTDIKDNSGWIDLNLKEARVFAHGDFFKNGNLFSGLLTVKRLKILGMDFPQMDANLKVVSKDYVVFNSILLKNGEGTAKIKGDYKKENLNLKAKLNGFPLKKALFFLDKQTLDDIEIFGAVEGDVSISGKYDNPEVKGSVTLLHTNIYGLFFPTVNADFTYENFKLSLSDIYILSGEGNLKGGGSINFDNGKIDLSLKGKNAELNYLPLEDLYAEGSDGNIKIYGSLDSLRINANFNIKDVMFSDISFGEGNLALSMKNNDVNIFFDLKNGLTGKGIVKNGEKVHFDFKAKDFVYSDDNNSVIVRGFFGFSGDVNDLSTFKGEGLITSLIVKNGINFRLHSNNISFKMQGLCLYVGKLRFYQKEPDIKIDLSHLTLDMKKDDISSDVTYETDGSLINGILKEQGVNGVSINGNIKGNVKLSGVIYSPFFLGDANFSGELTLKDAGYNINNVRLKVDFDYDLFKIKDFYGEIKDGSIRINGTVLRKDLDIHAKLHKIPVDMPGFYADASGIIFLKSESGAERYIASGYLQLKNGILKVEQMLSGETEESILDDIDLDLKTSLEGVTYSDKDISLMFGKSNLKMTGSASNPILHGVQYISKDSYLNIGDNRFFVERGKLVFDNPLENNPYVDIVASADLSNYKVRCFLKGSSDKINIKFLSDPPLNQNKILSILFGGGINTGIYDFYHTGNNENLSGVGAALALNTILSSFNSKMERTLKVDKFSISSQVFDVTRSPSPVMSFEKNLSSRLSFLFAQSLDTGGNLMELTYHMAGKRNVYIRNEIDGSITLEFEIIK